MESERGQEMEVDERAKKTEVVSTSFGRAAACTCFEGDVLKVVTHGNHVLVDEVLSEQDHGGRGRGEERWCG